MILNQEETWLLKEKHDGVESEAFLADVERLRAGEPLAYVIGHIPFLGCRIHLDSHPLIPRPETEYWVEKAIAEIKIIGANRVLDLCAGSGCIGVAVAKHCPGVNVTLAEIDSNHLRTIQNNIALNVSDVGGRYAVLQSDLFEKVSGKFDFILSNPPYIDPAIDRTEESVKNHEPHLALYGGEQGMEIVERIIEEASQYLNPGGQLWIEHEPEQSKDIQEKSEVQGFSVSTHSDQYGSERCSILVLP